MNGVAYRRIGHRDGVAYLERARTGRLTDQPARVVIAPLVVGVCRSDLRELDGTRHLRRDFGHEIVAEVRYSTLADTLPVGRRVVLDPHPVVRRTSGFADLVEIEGTVADVAAALRPVPADSDPLAALFTEPLACAAHCLARVDAVIAATAHARPSPVAVVGAGIAGTLMAGILRSRGTEVHLVNRGGQRLRFLAERDVLPGVDLHPADRPGRGGFACVVLATAAATGAALELAAGLTGDDGVLMIYAGTEPGSRFLGQDIDAIRRGEGRVTVHDGRRRMHLAGSHGATAADFAVATRLLQDRREGPALRRTVRRLIDVEAPLDEGPALLREMVSRPYVGKAVLTPGVPDRG
ncbi:alcohol dehydrogenase catalytic domain-containing protein [Actinoplanes teichomyceticus]|uniref:Threonine dehydrogenase-like Zn-dependent dehydrogenase n=1 Tax=Actinoplanes teichomyceticus TaxID=1867 RepID=A0A561WKS5_ACTTI|nr:alcohol dehydrogenase catalytic domain-containing protein [Actinoplanes teichomyceticus]TWG24440.1 threonine dehydrogenase-like Zn-dependent dehydrogenase [Actinoplanes teichomyceticus]GIF12709.1 hypothetical protein Ate01nite_27410 [Actinoplanes teichomyceticus]